MKVKGFRYAGIVAEASFEILQPKALHESREPLNLKARHLEPHDISP